MLNETADPLDLELKRARVAAAVAALADEEERLADMLDETPDPLDLELKRARVTTAVAALADEEERLADMLDETPDPLDLELKRARVATAVAALAEEEARLADMLAPTDALLIGQRKAEVEVAAARVGDAEEALADLVNGPDPLVRALREREIESAESDLANAERDLASTEITAPIGGVVETVDTEAGDTVTPMAFAVEIVDTSVAEVDGVVDEIGVLFLNVGAEAVVTMDALLDQTLAGEVSSIETTGRTTGGVVSFPVRVRVEAPPGVDLREGLSASASVVLRETTDALLVPSAAIGGSFLQPTVLVQRDGAITEQPVSLGDGDDFNVVVLAGLNEGDAVVVESTGGDLGIFGALFGGGQRLRQFIGGRPPPGAGR
jgi:multidrug efflux pump subunit AcrA (membrane-fusion protein)